MEYKYQCPFRDDIAEFHKLEGEFKQFSQYMYKEITEIKNDIKDIKMRLDAITGYQKRLNGMINASAKIPSWIIYILLGLISIVSVLFGVFRFFYKP